MGTVTSDDGTTAARSAALILLGLGAFAAAQPLLDVLASHTAFLIAHRVDRVDLLLLSVVVSLGPGLVAFALFALLAIIAAKGSPTKAAAAPRRGPDPNKVYQVAIAGSATKGPASAKIAVVEFSDFQ